MTPLCGATWWSVAMDAVFSVLAAGLYGWTESKWVGHLPRWRRYLSVWVWAARFVVCVAMLLGLMFNSMILRLAFTAAGIAAHWWNCKTFIRNRYGEPIASEVLKGWWKP